MYEANGMCEIYIMRAINGMSKVVYTELFDILLVPMYINNYFKQQKLKNSYLIT